MIHFGDLRGILQYVPQFRGRVFVVAVDGAVAASHNFANILLDLAVLHSLNIRIVLVHGGGCQVQRLAEERGLVPSDTEGIGRTDDATLEVSIDAITRLTSDVMQALTALGLRAAVTNALIARPAGVVRGVDLGHTGRVERVETESLRMFLDQGLVPLVAPLGYDGRGNTLRLNSDVCAMEVAVALGASKIVYLSRDRLGETPRQLPVEAAEELAADAGEPLTDGFRSKLTQGAAACRAGVSRVHIIDGSINEALLRELFSNEGIATMVYVDTYLRIREATPADVAEILSLTHRSVEKDQLVRRTRRQITDRLGDFLMLEVDGNAVGTVAVHLDEASGVAELACLFIKQDHDGQGYGRRLVAEAEKRARALGAERLVALSTQAADYFRRVGGFRDGTPDELPPARRDRLAASGRNSKVLVKDL